MKLAQAKTSAFLSVLFIVVYGSCSWITSQRADVGTLYFEWERLIPFVPLMILPYMSIDLFFVAAPFLCSSDMERRVFSKRITMAIIVAGAFFLLMPFRFAFPRPQVDGWLGVIFQFLHGFDRPFNLFPSLHIALRTILAEIYGRHSKGFLHWITQIWFSLIGFSTVLTYQHHVIDVVGGFALATLCFYLVRESSTKLPVIKNARIGFLYGLGTLITIFLSMATWPWGCLFLWPTLSLGIVTAAYFGLGPSIFRKEDGSLPLSAKLILAPCLLGQHLSLLYYQRQCKPWDEVVPNLWIGRKLNDSEASQAVNQGVGAVLDVTSEFSEAASLLKTNYFNLPILDLTAPTPMQLEKAVSFIGDHIETRTVYVHCKIGYSRSATVVGAYLLKSGIVKTAEAAVGLMRRARPSLIVRPEAFQALQQFQVGFTKGHVR